MSLSREAETSELYTDRAAMMGNAAMKQAFRDFAREELGHKAKLEAVRRGEYAFGTGGREVKDLGLGDYLVESEPTSDMTCAEALVMAMKEEGEAHHGYMDLSGAIVDIALPLMETR